MKIRTTEDDTGHYELMAMTLTWTLCITSSDTLDTRNQWQWHAGHYESRKMALDTMNQWEWHWLGLYVSRTMTHWTRGTSDNDMPDTTNHGRWHWTLWTNGNDTDLDFMYHEQWHTGHEEPVTVTYRTLRITDNLTYLWTMNNDIQDTMNHDIGIPNTSNHEQWHVGIMNNGHYQQR